MISFADTPSILCDNDTVLPLQLEPKKSDMSIRVYNREALEELCREDHDARSSSISRKRVSSSTIERDAERKLSSERRAEREKREREDREKWTKEKVALERSKQAMQFKRMMAHLRDGKDMVDEIDRYIAQTDRARRQKVSEMHESWTNGVFERIQANVRECVDSISDKDLNAIKRKCFQDFIEAGNTKGALFLDTILDDYDPFKVRREIPKPRKLSSIQNPNRRILDKHAEENALITTGGKSGVVSVEKPKMRKILNVKEWGTGKFEATPHGHFAEMMSKDHSAMSPTAHKITASSVPFEHFKYYRGRCDEYARGKRIFLDKVNKSTIDLREERS